MSKFSSSVQRAGDDVFGPSQACVKPEIIARKEGKKAKIEVRDDGTYLEIDQDGTAEVLQSAKITLNDCLACSGCVTSAESVLITAQSTDEFLSQLDAAARSNSGNSGNSGSGGSGKTVVVSISPQSRASLAAHFRLTARQTHAKLITLFKQLGVAHVFDTSFSREFSLMESAAEFIARYRRSLEAPMPMLASACPGWICYAEKKEGNVILPYISTTKSPQQIMGTIVKYRLAQRLGVAADAIYHATVMPCYDKKLEASRDDFYNDIYRTRDVDCVLTSGEILDILRQRGIDFAALPESPIEQLLTNVSDDGELLYGVTGGSGGYSDYIFRRAAKELFNVEVGEVEFKAKERRGSTRSDPDLRVASLEVDGKTVMTFAIMNGFKNISNLLRTLKTSCPYQFVEVMACSAGCLNGGGQVRPEKGDPPREQLARVEAAYKAGVEPRLPEQNPAAQELYREWFDGCFSPDAKTNLHTQYHAREHLLSTVSVASDW